MLELATQKELQGEKVTSLANRENIQSGAGGQQVAYNPLVTSPNELHNRFVQCASTPCGAAATSSVELRGLCNRRSAYFVACLLMFHAAVGCSRPEPLMIAVIPRTSGQMLWEPVHHGAVAAASNLGVKVYWNASTREDDVDGQIALVEKVSSGRYKGLVLAPDHSLALITPVRRALASGLTTVILGSPLPISPGDNLFYILNDEEEGGRLAGQRVADLLHGQGSVAILGINPDIAGIVARARSLERFLTKYYPHVKVAVRRVGTFNVAHEQQVAAEVLKANPEVDVIVSLMSTSTHGAVSAIEDTPRNQVIKVIGFDPDSLLFDNAVLDSVVVEDMEGMGDRAIRTIYARSQRQPVPARVELKPMLVTRANVNSVRLQKMMALFAPESLHVEERN